MVSSSLQVETVNNAGGTDSSCFNWQEVWYPVHYVEDLDKNKPTPFTLLDRSIVIWWDRDQETWRVFEDTCPHRLALLSEGRINKQGQLECPYHGWSFNGLGECVDIPQQPLEGKAQISKRACATYLPTAVRQGLLFVYAGDVENAAKTKIPIVDPLEEEPEKWTVLNTFRDIPYDALTLLENVLDSSHVPYTHHGTIGKRENVSPVELQVTESNREGFKGIWLEGPRRGTLGTQYTTFVAPLLMWHELTAKQFGRTLTVVYATPISKGKSRLFARFPFQFNSKIPEFFIKLTPRWYSHINQNRILEDDQIFLHYQERFFEKLGGSSQVSKAFYLPTKADAYVFELHQWINQYSLDPFINQKLPPLIDKDILLERYKSHTENCSSCSQALKNIQTSKMLLGITIFLGLTLTPLLTRFLPQTTTIAVIATSIITLAGVIWLYLGKLEKALTQGARIPTRNLS